MRGGQHPAERGKIAIASEFEILEHQESLAAGRSMPQRLRDAHPGFAQSGEPVGFRGKSVGKFRRVYFHEKILARDARPVARVNAATRDALGGFDAERSFQLPGQTPESRKFAIDRRSTRISMKARSNL
jgi:hypothetical protein